MRNLTITRGKTFVGCAMKDHIYLRDEAAAELTIEGVPCRKIGEIKNGEQKTFPIGDGEQQVFLITDKLSKEYCNASAVIPAGEADVSLSGKHHFLLGSNPFRFDGVSAPEVSAKQKKNGRVGLVIAVAAVIFGIVFGYSVTSGLLKGKTAEPKAFSKEDFQITLTDAFKEVEQPGFFATYTSKTVMVFVVREDADIFGDISLEEYCRLVLEANGYADKTMQRAEGYYWFDFTDTPQNEELYYMAICCRNEDAFFVVNFATPATNQDRLQESFRQWAATIDTGT